MASAAVVARTSQNGLEYLVRETGRAEWAVSAQAAARFQNLQEATRAALRLPGALRAFAFPADSIAER
ncbi:hypothetical protein [Phenylobacterium sp.]|jgi:hypothetical protein|uniref:hypothetical protein n=1 Tax=Phenylobacterium sp. TaxID=1871053 RepID=UPI002E31CCD9|nr:hypothetical protein [Phenylobacterium sp.]HEX4712235.1 hypothetical protein [Phenylobacterium sp.]